MESIFALLIKGVAQAPLVAVFCYLWWTTRKDYLTENKRLIEAQKQKDKMIEEFTRVLEKMTISIELIKDRLR